MIPLELLLVVEHLKLKPDIFSTWKDLIFKLNLNIKIKLLLLMTIIHFKFEMI